MRISTLSIFVMLLASALNKSTSAQDYWELERRKPKPDDLHALVVDENGEPVSGVEVKAEIKRTVGFFTGSGTPPIHCRQLSDGDGKVRFSNESGWRDWVFAELEAKQSKDGKVVEGKDGIEDFKDLHWTISGYHPEAKSRVELKAYGKPSLWYNQEPVKLVVPTLRATRIRVISKTDSQPLGSVRLWVQRQASRATKDGYSIVNAFAWTDAAGCAVVWLPKGSYRVLSNNTVAIEGIKVQSPLFDLQEPVFDELIVPPPPRNASADAARREALRSGMFTYNVEQKLLKIEDSAPEILVHEIESPIAIEP